MAFQSILVDTRDGITTLTLNRPEVLNAFNDQMAHEVLAALTEIERDHTARCLVLTGAGRGFCAGQDVSALGARAAAGSFRQHLQETFHPIVSRLRALEIPVIGQINGAAAGAGFGIALACDLRYLAESAKFRYAFSGLGLAPDSGTSYFLPRLIGYARAFELAATNMPVTARAALELGLADGVFPDADLAAEVRTIALRLAQGPTRALGLLKRALNSAAGLSLDAALDYEADLQEIAGQTADHLEGVTAFLEKRPPLFNGL